MTGHTAGGNGLKGIIVIRAKKVGYFQKSPRYQIPFLLPKTSDSLCCPCPKQPSNAKVYAPRSVAAKGAPTETNGFDFDRLLPTAGWVKRAWQPSEDQLLSATSLDAVVFMRIFIFSLKVFGFGGIIGVFVLLPINFLGTQLDVDFSDLPNKSLDSFSISNVDDGSNWYVCGPYGMVVENCGKY